ncbi:MAG: hypothetical protein GX211_06545 [Clostridiaceae bacterium]|jgi:ABC-type glycerol-3-phosphate transport system substrate-binding protein|nr:hypothetical protein [Clostridiaceae bacterium]
MKKLIRNISFILVLAMLVALFAGCSGSKTGDSANNDSQTGATTNDPGNGTLTKPYTAHVICSRSMDDKGDYGYVFGRVLTEYQAANPNFSFDYEVVQQMDIPGKIALLIASDDVPDFFVTEAGGAMEAIIESGGIVNITWKRHLRF